MYPDMLCLLIFIMAVSMAVGYWKIIAKAGKPGWKGLVPFYNEYLLFDISWESGMYWVFLILEIFYDVLKLFSYGNSLVRVVMLFLGIAIFVIRIDFYYKLSAAFGHGVGFTIGLLCLEPVFMLILGLDSSKYIYTYDPDNDSDDEAGSILFHGNTDLY